MVRALLCGVLASCALATGSFAQSGAEIAEDTRNATSGPTVLFDRHGPREVTLVPASKVLNSAPNPGALENIYKHVAAKKKLMLVSDDAALTNVSNVRGCELMLLRYFQEARRGRTRAES